MKRLFNAIVAIVIVVSLFTSIGFCSFADDSTRSGVCGKSINYEFSIDDNSLSVNGEGKLYSNAREILTNAIAIRYNEVVYSINQADISFAASCDNRINQLKREGYYSGSESDYSKQVSNLNKTIQSLNAQISALTGLTDSASRAKKAQLESQRNSYQAQLDDLTRKHGNTVSINGLVDLKKTMHNSYLRALDAEKTTRDQNIETANDSIIKFGCDTTTNIESFEVIAIDNHNYHISMLVNNSCETYGKALYECVLCGDSYQELVAPKGHKAGEVIIDNEVTATCTTLGSFDEVKKCINCGQELSREHKTLPALGHNFGEWLITKAATCTEAGIETRVCANNASHTESKSIDALGHKYHTKDVAPTATSLGYTKYECSRCGDTYYKDYKSPLGKISGFKCKTRTTVAQTVTWNKINGATGYQVQISTKDGKKWSTYANLKGSVNTYTFKYLTAGNSYKFRVRFFIKGKDGISYYSPWSATLTSPTLPNGTCISKIVGASKAFTAQWKQNKTVNGYQIQYSTKSNFSGAKTITIKSNKTLKTAVKKLNAKKVYYVRIRTYKTITKVNYYSTWSTAVKVKTK